LFDEISPASAEYMLAIWRTSTRRHSIHASVYWNDERSGPRSSTKASSHRGHAKSEEPRLRYKATNVRSNP
jgi:hypothetical protein